MIRLSKLTDYGFVLLTKFAADAKEPWHTARDLADVTGLPLPTVSKLLKIFGRGGLLIAHRGARGGYSLSREATEITASDIIEAIDGPLAITECACSSEAEQCSIEHSCPTKPHWLRITQTIREALDRVTLAELAQPVHANAKAPDFVVPACRGGHCSAVPGKPCTCGDDQHNMGDIQK